MQSEVDNDTGSFIKRAVNSYCGGDYFDGMIRSSITKLMMKAVVPWIDQCFAKYDEYEFHMRMQQGFSFVKDFRENHSGGPGRDNNYLKFIKAARIMWKRFHIALDEEQIIRNVAELLGRRGWVLYEPEIQRMRADLLEIKAEIQQR